MEKMNIPYYQVAKKALMNWNGLNEEEANKLIENSSFEEIEAQIGASNSMIAASKLIGEKFELTEEETVEFINEILGKKDSRDIIKKIELKMNEDNKQEIININDLTFDLIESVHDDWCKQNAGIFFTKKADRQQQYQYLPIELIGFNEAKSDLLFIEPILNSFTSSEDVQNVQEKYNEEVKRLLIKIKGDSPLSKEELEKAISKNKIGYENWSTEIQEAMKNPEFVKNIIIPQILSKGLGKDTELIQILEEEGVVDFNTKSLEELKEEKEMLEKELNSLSREDI